MNQATNGRPVSPSPTMASIISPIIGWILTLAGYYFAAATLSCIVLTFAKAMRNLNDAICPTTKKKRRKCDNPSLTSTKPTRNARAVSHCAEASSTQKNAKCTPPSFYSGGESNTAIKGASGHPLAPSSPPNKNSVHPHPPDLIEEEEPKQIRHLVDAESSTEPPTLPPRCPFSPQIAAAGAALEPPKTTPTAISMNPNLKKIRTPVQSAPSLGGREPGARFNTPTG